MGVSNSVARNGKSGTRLQLAFERNCWSIVDSMLYNAYTRVELNCSELSSIKLGTTIIFFAGVSNFKKKEITIVIKFHR